VKTLNDKYKTEAVEYFGEIIEPLSDSTQEGAASSSEAI
jgi:hypothetical protein